jgi:hypothetical protein
VEICEAVVFQGQACYHLRETMRVACVRMPVVFEEAIQQRVDPMKIVLHSRQSFQKGSRDIIRSEKGGHDVSWPVAEVFAPQSLRTEPHIKGKINFTT